MASAIEGLTREQRIALVPALTTLNLRIDAHEIPAQLVDGDDEVYRSLLAMDELRDAHRAPLRDPTRPEWAALARRALEAGYQPQEIAESSLGVSERLGDDTARLNRCLDTFRRLRSEDQSELADIGRAGERLVAEHLATASALERQHALRGF